MKVKVERVNWFSTYRVHHRVTEKFRKGRAFLLGDAAHIHSPAGGQGMNTGIGDAINLAWKLKSVLKDGAGDTLLDTYETERRAIAKVLVATTDKAFTLATAEGRIADFIRLHVVPLLLPNVLRFHAAREFIFGAVTQIALAYHGSPLSRGRTGQIEGGDRLPWAPAPGADNFDTLSQLDWQVHVYGTADPATRTWCQANNVALNVFRWQPAHEKAGFVQNALYLVRPDSYIGLASPSQGSELLSTYFAELRLDPPRRARAGKPA